MGAFWDSFGIFFDENFSCAMGGWFFLLGIALVVVLGFMGLLKRNRWWYSLLVGINYVYLPIAVAVLGSIFYAFGVVEDGMRASVQAARSDIIAASVEHTKAVSESLPFMRGDASKEYSLKDMTEEITTAYVKEYLGEIPEDLNIGVLGKIVSPMQEGIGKMLAEAVTDKLAETLEGKTQIPAESWRRVWSSGIDSLMQGGIVVEVIQGLVDKVLNTVRPQLYTASALALGPSFLEIFLYQIFSRRRRRAVAA